MKSRYLMVAALAGAVLSGCNGLLKPPESFTTYDLGVPQSRQHTPDLLPWRIEVKAPSWLASSAMQYRLAYADANARDTYAHSRWAANPAEMLERHFEAGLVGENANVSACRLTLELDEFVQTFEAVDASESQIALRAALKAPRRSGTLARKHFHVQVPASSADARGGAKAHREAAAQLSTRLAAWLDSLSGRSEISNQCAAETQSRRSRRLP